MCQKFQMQKLVSNKILTYYIEVDVTAASHGEEDHLISDLNDKIKDTFYEHEEEFEEYLNQHGEWSDLLVLPSHIII